MNTQRRKHKMARENISEHPKFWRISEGVHWSPWLGPSKKCKAAFLVSASPPPPPEFSSPAVGF
jgi:hypothetical protein